MKSLDVVRLRKPSMQQGVMGLLKLYFLNFLMTLNLSKAFHHGIHQQHRNLSTTSPKQGHSGMYQYSYVVLSDWFPKPMI